MWYKLLISAVILVFTHNQVFAKELFRSEFENGLLKYVGKSNRHPGGGFVGWLGGKVDSYYDPGDGCDSATSGKQNVNITSEAAAQGGPAGAQSSALKTFYRVFDNCGQSFQKNTTIIGIPQVPEVYVRFYQKWSSTWIWPTIQQKFAKIRNKDKTSTQNFYFKKDGVMEVSYVKLGKALSPNDPSDDDFPAGEIDMAINQWHEVQMHVKMSEPGKSNGMIEYWINGVQQFGLYDIENNNGSDVNTNGISHLELQHVYETGSPKSGPKQDMPTWMKNIVVSTTFIPSGGCPLCPKPPSNVQAVKK